MKITDYETTTDLKDSEIQTYALEEDDYSDIDRYFDMLESDWEDDHEG